MLAAPQLDVQHAAAGDPEIAVQGAFELRIQLLDGDRGEKAEAAQVHGEQREIVAHVPSDARAAESSVPSPPSTTSSCDCAATWSRERASARPA